MSLDEQLIMMQITLYICQNNPTLNPPWTWDSAADKLMIINQLKTTYVTKANWLSNFPSHGF
jgi:hypothetical protein